MSSEPPSYDSLFPISISGVSFTAIPDPNESNQIEPAKYRGLLTLPAEIVEQIFVHACQPFFDPGSAVNGRWRRDFYPLWLGRICRAWRESAWACSELWTDVVIRIDRNEQNINKQISLLSLWLDRAKGRPLNIYIEELYPGRVLAGAVHHSQMSIIATLCRCSKQWRRIDLNIPYRCYAHSTSRQPSTHPFLNLSLPLLQHVSICIPDARHDAELQLDLNQAPLLRILSVTCFMEAGLLSQCPTKQITKLIIKSCSMSVTLQELFHLFPKLTELTWNESSMGRLPRRPLTHDHLQAFDIDLDHAPHYIFHFLCFPNLRRLTIRTPHTFSYSRVLVKFFEQSGSTLSRLTIECQLTAEHDLIELFSSSSISSSLQELFIRHIPPAREEHFDPSEDKYSKFGLSRTFFDNLHPDEDSNYLTRLETLEYEGPLTVQAIDFIEPLIIRSRIRLSDWSESTSPAIAMLKRAKIKADQFSAFSEFSIAEYTDTQYVWEVLRLLEEGILVLINTDGSRWE